jgi:hypothetical protein
LKDLSTNDAAGPAWRDYGEVILVESDEELAQVGDLIASEHTQIIHKNPQYFLENIKNYGSLFVSVESMYKKDERADVADFNPGKSSEGDSQYKIVEEVSYPSLDDALEIKFDLNYSTNI